MQSAQITNKTLRYKNVTKEKEGGATYTPTVLADFVAKQIISSANNLDARLPIRILDPAVGHGGLLVSVMNLLDTALHQNIELVGFETDKNAAKIAATQLKEKFPSVNISIENKNFLQHVSEHFSNQIELFSREKQEQFDIVIANPPYVRTQILGPDEAQALSNAYGLKGRVDLYYAFILTISDVLCPDGIAGIIVSNRFMSTRSGASVREAILDKYSLLHAWDLGDTKLFDAAVLPAVMLLCKSDIKEESPKFSSIYETVKTYEFEANDQIDALEYEGIVRLADGRCFEVQHGQLHINDDATTVWRLSSKKTEAWLSTVADNTWATFDEIGKIRVGVKTCADKIFIRKDWTLEDHPKEPELLKPLTTHHVARRFKPKNHNATKILYPHEVVNGHRRPSDLSQHPRSSAYLEQHRETLQGRSYVEKAGRKWYEIWVPQDPQAWGLPKLVFRDISEEPTFWLDLEGTVVNGDCYWLTCQDDLDTDLLWLAAAVANSKFIERFYDLKFNNKLYAGRRRYMTQYVEKFPLPDPSSIMGKQIIAQAKNIYEELSFGRDASDLENSLDLLIWKAFGHEPDTDA